MWWEDTAAHNQLILRHDRKWVNGIFTQKRSFSTWFKKKRKSVIFHVSLKIPPIRAGCSLLQLQGQEDVWGLILIRWILCSDYSNIEGSYTKTQTDQCSLVSINCWLKSTLKIWILVRKKFNVAVPNPRSKNYKYKKYNINDQNGGFKERCIYLNDNPI